MTRNSFYSTLLWLSRAALLLSVLYFCAKVGVRYFELESEPVEPFRFQAGVKV